MSTETKEQKLQRLREEQEARRAIKQASSIDEFRIENGVLYRKSRYVENEWETLLHINMPVKVYKPFKFGQKPEDNRWRRGVVIKLEFKDGAPLIHVSCGKKCVVFQKRINEVIEDKRGDELVLWDNINIPDRLKKMSTKNLLREFRKVRRPGLDGSEEAVYKAELAAREHIGTTDSKAQKVSRRDKLNGKRNR